MVFLFTKIHGFDVTYNYLSAKLIPSHASSELGAWKNSKLIHFGIPKMSVDCQSADANPEHVIRSERFRGL